MMICLLETVVWRRMNTEFPAVTIWVPSLHGDASLRSVCLVLVRFKHQILLSCAVQVMSLLSRAMSCVTDLATHDSYQRSLLELGGSIFTLV